MHYFADYGLFLAKALTLVIALLILMGGIIALITKSKESRKGQLEIKKLNEHYEETEDALREEILPKKEYKNFIKNLRKSKKSEKEILKKIYVLRFNGDIRASAVEHFREEITAVLSIASPRDEVVVCLESAGGMVHSYGLAASQLQRIKEKKIPLTIIIDKVAASGGYLMACVADKILAAPFAIIGSIGVIAQIPNFHKVLVKNNIDFEQISAGEYKRTLTLFGENTDKARDKMKQEVEEVHYYFKNFITLHRPHVNINEVSTGEHWLATKALELKLVDELTTSDDYLFDAHKTADIFEITFYKKKNLSDKLSSVLEKQSRWAGADNFLFK